MKLRSFLVCAVAAMLPAIAAAQEARALNPVALRAGPDREYPFVASYDRGTPLAVQGCTDGYGWCDVIGPNGYRGWVYAGDIAYPYQRRQVPVLGYGPMIGIPIISFAVGPYWATHYPNRAWYRDRDHWAHYQPVYRPVRPVPARPVVVHQDRPHPDRPHSDRPHSDRPHSDRPNPGVSPPANSVGINGRTVPITPP